MPHRLLSKWRALASVASSSLRRCSFVPRWEAVCGANPPIACTAWVWLGRTSAFFATLHPNSSANVLPATNIQFLRCKVSLPHACDHCAALWHAISSHKNAHPKFAVQSWFTPDWMSHRRQEILSIDSCMVDDDDKGHEPCKRDSLAPLDSAHADFSNVSSCSMHITPQPTRRNLGSWERQPEPFNYLTLGHTDFVARCRFTAYHRAEYCWQEDSHPEALKKTYSYPAHLLSLSIRPEMSRVELQRHCPTLPPTAAGFVNPALPCM